MEKKIENIRKIGKVNELEEGIEHYIKKYKKKDVRNDIYAQSVTQITTDLLLKEQGIRMTNTEGSVVDLKDTGLNKHIVNKNGSNIKINPLVRNKAVHSGINVNIVESKNNDLIFVGKHNNHHGFELNKLNNKEFSKIDFNIVEFNDNNSTLVGKYSNHHGLASSNLDIHHSKCIYNNELSSLPTTNGNGISEVVLNDLSDLNDYVKNPSFGRENINREVKSDHTEKENGNSYFLAADIRGRQFDDLSSRAKVDDKANKYNNTSNTTLIHHENKSKSNHMLYTFKNNLHGEEVMITVKNNENIILNASNPLVYMTLNQHNKNNLYNVTYKSNDSLSSNENKEEKSREEMED